MIKNILLVGAGGFLGRIARYLIAVLMKGQGTMTFPWATLAANVLGCLLIGLLWAAFNRYSNSQLDLLLVTGFCGGFTTFSTFSRESLVLLQSGNYALFTAYALGSIVLGLLAVIAGFAIAK